MMHDGDGTILSSAMTLRMLVSCFMRHGLKDSPITMPNQTVRGCVDREKEVMVKINSSIIQKIQLTMLSRPKKHRTTPVKRCKRIP